MSKMLLTKSHSLFKLQAVFVHRYRLPKTPLKLIRPVGSVVSPSLGALLQPRQVTHNTVLYYSMFDPPVTPDADWFYQLNESQQNLYYASDSSLLLRAFRLRKTSTLIHICELNELAYMSSMVCGKSLTDLSFEKWIDIAKDSSSHLSLHNFRGSDTLPYLYLMYFFTVLNDENVLLAFIKYLREKGKLDSDITLRSIYMLAVFRKKHQAFMLDLSNYFFQTFPGAEGALDIHLLQSFQNTQYWKIGFHLMKILGDETSTRWYGVMICCALRENDLETVNAMVKESVEKNKGSRLVHIIREQLALSYKHGSLSLDQLIDMVNQTDDVIHESTAKYLAEYISEKNQDWTISLTNVDEEGVCQSCHKALQTEHFEQHQLTEFKDALLENVQERVEVPAEVIVDLERQIVESGPFDVLIDSENLLFVRTKANVENIKPALDYFCGEKGMKVLVLNVRLPSHLTRSLSKKFGDNVQFFTVRGGKGADDFLVLYAALLNGYPTYIVSNDVYRDFAFKMEGLNFFFRNWLSCQLISQYRLKKMPSTHKNQIQRDGDSLHVPFMKADPSPAFIKEDNFMCIKQGKKIKIQK